VGLVWNYALYHPCKNAKLAITNLMEVVLNAFKTVKYAIRILDVANVKLVIILLEEEQ